MNIVIIGCGLIGKKRALALKAEDRLLACCDVNLELSKKFSEQFGCKYYTDYKKLLAEIPFDSAIVAVVNKYAAEIIISAIRNSKHVLAEKPLGRNLKESCEIIDTLKLNRNVVLKTGFNHRFHPAVLKAKQFADEEKIGKIITIRGMYGHGGRPGMEGEWRASRELCGGGELLDQGVHLIDLIRWFGGEVKGVYGSVETKFWDIEVEDNAFAILNTQNNVSAIFHVSWTNWKNIFSFEIFGTDGYLKIEGLGGSYGQERLELGIRKKEGGIPITEVFEFPNEDVSWNKEWEEFENAVEEKREALGSGFDGFKANEVIDAIYRSSKEKKIIAL